MTQNGKRLGVVATFKNVTPRTAASFCFIVEYKNYSRVIFVTPDLLLMSARSRCYVCRLTKAANPMCVP